MRVSVSVADGPYAGRKVWLMAGQIAEVGRDASVDLAVPGDSEMAGVHFTVECDATSVRVRNVNEDKETLVNGAAVSEATVHDGDRVTAGGTSFDLRVEVPSTQPPPSSASETVTAEAAAKAEEEPQRGTDYAKVEAEKAAEICERFKLEDGKVHLREHFTPKQFLHVLIENELFVDAVRFLAHAMPARETVWWGHQCAVHAAGEKLDPAEREALDAIRKWVEDPTDENRRAAMPAAEGTNYHTPAGLIALGTFYSGGSVAPPGQDEVPPAEGMGAQLTAAGILLAGPKAGGDVNEWHRQFIALGEDVADGKNVWEEKQGR